jgi:hypothetical protein
VIPQERFADQAVVHDPLEHDGRVALDEGRGVRGMDDASEP